MKKKIAPFIQHLGHDIDDEDKAFEHLAASLPLVGHVVMSFNNLERSLGSILCEIISDRSDALGLLVLQNLSYGAQVDLFKRICDDIHLDLGKRPAKFEGLIDSLVDVGRLRNMVVHADWANTDHEGYTFVKVKITVRGMEQEYIQFSPESLEKLIDRINDTNQQLSDYWEDRGELIWRS